MNKTVLIIGGGVGGLFTGAFLAKEGFKVTVLEKNQVIGGGLQTFKRKGVVFETGMHILGGFQPGGSLNKICSYLGIMDKLSICDSDDDCIDSISYLADNKTYRIAKGRDHFVQSLSEQFPHEKENLIDYVNELYHIADSIALFNLRLETDNIFSYPPPFLDPADEFIARYIKDPKLMDILGYMNPMYGGIAGHTPTYIHALINVLYIEGASKFKGSSQQLATALSDVITSSGGYIYTRKEVSAIKTENHRIKYVETSDATRFEADKYISAIHPCSLLKIIDDAAFPKSFRNRLHQIPNSYSVFTIFVIFKDNAFPYMNHTGYYQDDYGLVWSHGEYDEATWPRGLMYMTPPEEGQGKYANKMIINCIMNFEQVRHWENTTVGKRGKDYLQWKQIHIDKALNKMETIFPGFKDSISDTYSSSPLTIRDYYNIKDGSLYGFQKDCQNILLSQLSIYTKVDNLLLTGQNINLHGICGVPLTAINTVEAIIGKNNLINQINQAYDK